MTMNLHHLLLRISAFVVLATTLGSLQAKEEVAKAPALIDPTVVTPAKNTTEAGKAIDPRKDIVKTADVSAPAGKQVTPGTLVKDVVNPTPAKETIPSEIDLKLTEEPQTLKVGYNKSRIPFKDWFSSKIKNEEPILTSDTRTIAGMVGTIPDKVFWFIDQLKQSDISTTNNLFQRRLILYGPPGNGKSTLAGAIARDADCNFILVKGSRIITTYQGQGSQSIDETFSRAAKTATETGRPTVIFFDEVDAIARENTLETRGEQQAALQTLWLCLDEYKNDARVCVICATNHFDRLDKTFLDRFGINTVEIGHPDAESRKAVITFYMQQHHLDFAPELVNDLVKKSSGYSVRSIEEVIRTIGAVLVRRTNKALSSTDIDAIITANNRRDINKQLGEEQASSYYEGVSGYFQRACDKIYSWTNWPRVESMAQKFLLVSNVILNAHHLGELSNRHNNSPTF